MPGVVSLPHGWGHDAPGARLRVAAAHAGANANALADEELVDALSGNAVLNGIPVAVAPVAARRPGVSGDARTSRRSGCSTASRATRARRGWRCCERAARRRRDDRGAARPPCARAGSRSLPAERALGAGGRPDPARAGRASRPGVDLAIARGGRRAVGPRRSRRPTIPGSATLELAGARIVARFVEAGLPLDGLIEAARVFGEAAAHAAAAAGTLANAALPQPGDTELRLRAAARPPPTRELTPPTPRSCSASSTGSTCARTCASEIVARRGARRGAALATCTRSASRFCDLVGFTRLGEGVPAADLGAIATRLAALAADVAEPPVRLVKTIGDAVMLVAPEPAPLLEAALGADGGGGRGRGRGLPRTSTPGAAHGPALRRWGDYYGGPVNLAARLAERARPGVAAHRRGGARAAPATTGFAWSAAGREAAQGARGADRRSGAAGAPTRARTARPCGVDAGRSAADARPSAAPLRCPMPGSVPARARGRLRRRSRSSCPARRRSWRWSRCDRDRPCRPPSTVGPRCLRPHSDVHRDALHCGNSASDRELRSGRGGLISCARPQARATHEGARGRTGAVARHPRSVSAQRLAVALSRSAWGQHCSAQLRSSAGGTGAARARGSRSDRHGRDGPRRPCGQAAESHGAGQRRCGRCASAVG